MAWSSVWHKLAGRPTPTPGSAPSPAPVTSAPVTSTPVTSTVPNRITRRASGGQPYDAATSTRRLQGWQPSRQGPTTDLTVSLDILRARSRDEIRNNPWARSAVDNFESQIIGRGIRPHWNLADIELKAKIEKAFDAWARTTACDANGLSSFYGLQALLARELFEAGEVLIRRYIRRDGFDKRLKVPLQLLLIPGEQLPVWRSMYTAGDAFVGVPAGNSVRTGIEFDPDNRRTAYHMYRENPGETMFYPLSGLTFVRVPATEILHVYKPFRTGQLRGQPHLASTLALLHEINKYTDAAVQKKIIQTMFAAWIKKVSPDSNPLPPDPNAKVVDTGEPATPANNGMIEPGVQQSLLESGTIQVLFEGEDVVFPNLPQESDYQAFLSVSLHQFAAGCGATYEQITGDLRGVNLSSIRAGLLDFRRKCEQFQLNVIVSQAIEPIVRWWLDEAVLAGELSLPGYASDPDQYMDIAWGMPGWPWIDPVKDAEANLMNVRAGFDSRENVVAQAGGDVATIDAQQEADNKRADGYKLVYDSRTDEVLTRGETAEGEVADQAAGQETRVAKSIDAPGKTAPPKPATKPATKPAPVPVAPAPAKQAPAKAASRARESEDDELDPADQVEGLTTRMR